MPRQPILAFGLVALALALGPVPSPRASAADEPPKPAATAALAAPAGAPEAHPAAMTPKEAEHLEEGHGGGGEPNILEPQPSLALWTVVVFLGLMFVLGRFAWKPLLTALHQREEHLEHVLLETERARNEGEQLLAEHRRQLVAAEDQIRAMIEEARRHAQTAADDIVRKAQDEADASQQRARRDIATAKDQALSEIWSSTADLAVSVAGKVLGRTLSEDDHRRLIDSAVGELKVTTNGHGGSRS
jgi:F-type H+-transporting ATPase subunit b